MTVPSSTSSSSDRLWIRTWVLSLALVIVLVGGWEAFWRARGFTPSISDTWDLWAAARRRVGDDGSAAVALIGSSRIQLAIDPDAFVAATGWSRPVQLAIPMAPAIPVLEDLAYDPSFTGTVICGVNPLMLFSGDGFNQELAIAYLDHYRETTAAGAFEQSLRAASQRGLVSRLPALFPAQLRRALQDRKWPEPHYIVTTQERFALADFQLIDLRTHNYLAAASREKWLRRVFTEEELLARVAEIEELVQMVRAKGGKVVFVRLPTSLHIRKDEARWYPRGRFWDVFSDNTSALTIHFEDFPELARYRPPDGEHLGKRSASRFSSDLGRILLRELEDGR
jgi:hypothetical protein